MVILKIATFTTKNMYKEITTLNQHLLQAMLNDKDSYREFNDTFFKENNRYYQICFKNFGTRSFSNLDLSDLNLENADLSGCYFDNTNFSNCNFRYANFKYGSFKNAIMTNCIFTEAKFDYANFDNANLSYAKIHPSLCATEINNASFQFVDFSNSSIHNTIMRSCDLRKTNFQSYFSNCKFEKCLLDETNLFSSSIKEKF